MNIQFEFIKFDEEDSSWEALFIKTDDKDWHMAKPVYGTEDIEKIKEIIEHE